MLKPLGKNILVQKKKEEQKKGALILTANNDNPYQAIVMDIGSKAELDIKIGDTLLMIPYSGSKISTDDDGYVLVTERDILGVLV